MIPDRPLLHFVKGLRASELEVDEGHHLGRDKLIDEEDAQHDTETHEGKGKARESDAVTALQTCR